MIRGRIIFQKPQIRYMPYKWLVGDGSACIDTNIRTLTNTMVFRFRTSATTTIPALGRDRRSWSDSEFLTRFRCNYLGGYNPVLFQLYTKASISIKTAADDTITIDFVNNTITSETSGQSAGIFDYSSENAHSIVLFGYHTLNGNYSPAAVDFSFFRIDNVVNLIPCKLLAPIPPSLDANGIRREKDECGFYDSVSGLFFGNVGSGAFTVSDN